MNEHKLATEQFGTWGNNLAMIAHREADGEAEVHEKVVDYIIVESGDATIVVGGTVPNGKTTAPGEIRGPSIEGGVKKKLATGDVLRIPQNTPHQLLVEKGKQFTYMVVKVTVP
jgi:mannose-6-phosphate isomerase-like protein (cupin superfamily)